jgi:hypothetical protein
MTKYRKKPVVVEAEQFWPEQKPWPEGVEQHGFGFWLKTVEGWYVADVACGDWIVDDPRDGLRVYKSGEFEAICEKVEP